MNLPGKEALIGIGRTADVFAWQDHQVIKLFHAGCSPELVEYEMAKSQMISAMNLPTPKFIGMLEIKGRQGLIYERVYGVSMLKTINQHPWLLFRHAKQLAELHSCIHQQDGSGFPPLHAELGAVIQWIASLPGMPVDDVKQLLIDLPEGHALCHFDFHPDQVMLTAKGPVILDWATAYQGHPLADVARTIILFKVGQVPYGGRLMQIITNLWRGLFLKTYLTRYFNLNPHMRRRDLEPWLIPVAVGRLHEGIPGEQEALLGMIARTLAALGIIFYPQKR